MGQFKCGVPRASIHAGFIWVHRCAWYGGGRDAQVPLKGRHYETVAAQLTPLDDDGSHERTVTMYRSEISPAPKLVLGLFIVAGALLYGLTQSEARKENPCNTLVNRCMRNCTIDNADAKNIEAATDACQSNCGRQWKACKFDGQEAPTSLDPGSPPPKGGKPIAKPGGGTKQQ